MRLLARIVSNWHALECVRNFVTRSNSNRHSRRRSKAVRRNLPREYIESGRVQKISSILRNHRACRSSELGNFRASPHRLIFVDYLFSSNHHQNQYLSFPWNRILRGTTFPRIYLAGLYFLACAPRKALSPLFPPKDAATRAGYSYHRREFSALLIQISRDPLVTYILSHFLFPVAILVARRSRGFGWIIDRLEISLAESTFLLSSDRTKKKCFRGDVPPRLSAQKQKEITLR